MGNESGSCPVYHPMEFLIEPRLAPPPAAQGDVVVKPPPEVPPDVPGNPLARLMPVAMVVGTVGMMAVYLPSGASATRNPMFMFFPVMIAGSLLGTMVSGTRGGGRIGQINHDRRKYLRYLASLDSSIVATVDSQRRSLVWSSPDPCVLWTMIGRRRMWERRPGDADFARVRVGLSSQPLSTPLLMPDLAPAEEHDPVTAIELRRLFNRRAMVPDLPICLALKEIATIAVSGDLDAARDVLRAVICQLALTHGPENLRIAAVVSPLTA